VAGAVLGAAALLGAGRLLLDDPRRLDDLTWAGWGRVAARLAWTVPAVALLAEALARTGAGIAGWLGGARLAGLERAGIRLLLGFGTLGTAWLGLGAVGALAPAPMLGSLALLAAAGAPAGGCRGLTLAPFARAARGTPWWGRIALAAVLLPALPRFLAPLETEIDAETYHLGFAWQGLRTGRWPLSHVPHTFHYALPVDAAFGLAVVLDHDAVARWLSAVGFAGGAAAAAGLGGGWLAPVLAWGDGLVHWLAATAKNDVPAAACLVAGAALLARRRAAAGAACLGLGVAVKIAYAPFAVVCWLALCPPPRRWPGPLALAVLPFLPWAAKAWLATGNPVYPFAWRVFPSLEWEAANQTAFLSYASRFWVAGTDSPWTVPVAWWGRMRAEHLPLLLAVPGLIAWRATRRPALAAAGGMLALLATARASRFLLPGAWLLAGLAARGAAALPGPWRGPGVALAALAGIAGAWPAEPGWEHAFRPAAAVRADALTTRLAALRALEEIGAGRVAVFGEIRTHRFPCRVLYGGVKGETPLAWRIAKESPDAERIAIRFRQLGAGAVLLNFVSAEWLATRHRPFPWTLAMLRRYESFVQGWLEPAASPERSDYFNGGFYAWRVRGRPARAPAAPVFFLPGVEAPFGPAIALEDAGRTAEALGAAESVARLLPEVGHVWSVVGHLRTALGDARGAREAFERFGRLGMVDTMNVGEWGAVVLRTGGVWESGPLLARAYRLYPDHRDVIRVNLALRWALQAHEDIVAGRLGRAEERLDLAEFSLGHQEGTAPSNASQDRSRVETRAVVLGIRGEWLAAHGRAREAAAAFAAAALAAPDAPLAATWRRLAAQASPPPLGAVRP
jgi:hypothetical protein